MTLDELQKQLNELAATLPGDTIVVMSEDGEGNGFSPLAEAEVALYQAETTWSGERYMTEEQRQAEPNPDEWDEAPESAVLAVFLWPTN